jgi:hypothetical protein
MLMFVASVATTLVVLVAWLAKEDRTNPPWRGTRAHQLD